MQVRQHLSELQWCPGIYQPLHSREVASAAGTKEIHDLHE